MKKIPRIHVNECNMCTSCIEICPESFKENSLGFIEVIAMISYPEKKVEKAMAYCPKNCIGWDLV